MKRIELKPNDDMTHYEREDSEEIRKQLNANGYDASLPTIAKLWRVYSDDYYSAGWTRISDDSWWSWINYAQAHDLIEIIDE